MNDKKVGRPKGRTYTIRKEILLTKKQAKNWNPNKIRSFLESNGKHKITTIRESKDKVLPQIIKILQSEKKSIPIERFRSLLLELKIIKER